MTLSDLASLGSFVSAVAVLISLVYLALQVRQAAKHSRALISQQHIDRIVDILHRWAEADLASVIVKAETEPSALSQREFAQYINAELGRFLNSEDTFLQHRSGLLDQQAFMTFLLNNQRVMTNASTRNAWRILRPRFDSRFAEFMDAIVARSETQPPVDQYAEWLALATPTGP